MNLPVCRRLSLGCAGAIMKLPGAVLLALLACCGAARPLLGPSGIGEETTTHTVAWSPDNGKGRSHATLSFARSTISCLPLTLGSPRRPVPPLLESSSHPKAWTHDACARRPPCPAPLTRLRSRARPHSPRAAAPYPRIEARCGDLLTFKWERVAGREPQEQTVALVRAKAKGGAVALGAPHGGPRRRDPAGPRRPPPRAPLPAVCCPLLLIKHVLLQLVN